MSNKPRIRIKYANDGLQSFTHAVGDPERDKSASVYFGEKIISDRELACAYEGNWMARALVDIPVMDALRKGWQWGGESAADIVTEEKRLNVRGKLMQAYKKGRLFGGAAIYIGTDQDPSEPLEVEKLPVGGIKYLNVMTRLQLSAGAIDTYGDSETYGMPKSYRLSSSKSGVVDIHPSRLVIFNGDERADVMTMGTSTGWAGQSTLQSAYDALTNAQGVHSSVASLIYEANIDVLGIPDLMANIDEDWYESALLKRIRLFTLAKGVNGMGVMDATETLTRNSASFANLDKIMDSFESVVAAAGQIPVTRFMQESPRGLTTTGEGDMKNYHDLIQSKQELEIDPAAARLFPAIRKSALGTDEAIPRTWQPLEQMSDVQLSAIAKETAETLKISVDSLGVSQDEARVLFAHKMEESGALVGMEDIITEALGSSESSS